MNAHKAQVHPGVNEHGEVVCQQCVEGAAALRELQNELRLAEIQQAGDAKTIKSLSYKLEEARRDKEAEMREHESYDAIMDLFELWLRASEMCERSHNERKTQAKKRSKLSADRFFMVLPFANKEGIDTCQQAIIGRVFQHYADRRANGSTIRYFEIERIFGAKGRDTARGNFEESANRAPPDWRQRVEALMSDDWRTTSYRWGVSA